MGVAIVVLAVMTGCQTPLHFYHPSMDRPTPAEIEPPRELAKMSLPAYRIEAPDVLQIEVPKLIPKPPYRVEVYDVLQVNVLGTLVDQPVLGYFLVNDEGRVNLGPAYGEVRVAGMTVPETQQAITTHLKQILAAPEVAVQLAQASSIQPITGIYLVGPDGTVNLRQYGSVFVAGMSLVEAKVAMERHLAQYLDSPSVAVDIAAYNSKVYYVITEGAGMGDSVVRVPVTGNETVLDAISQINGLSQLSSKQIWIARPAPSGTGAEQHLPIDWNAITRGAATATNYQVLPGDRIFIAEDKMWALTNYIAKITAPLERVLGFSSLGASTIRQFNNINTRTGVY